MPENPKSLSENCRHDGISTVFLIVSSIFLLFVPITSVLSITLHKFDISDGSCIGYSLLVVSYIISQVSMLIILRRTHERKQIILQDGNKRFVAHKIEAEKAHLLIKTLFVILALGDSLVNLTEFGDQIIFLMNEKEISTRRYAFVILKMIENAYKWFHHLYILMFIVCHDKFKKAIECFWSKLFISILAFSCLVQWLFVILMEVNEQERLERTVDVATEAKCVGEDPCKVKFNTFTHFQPLLFPLGIEFRIMCFLELASISLMSNEGVCVQAYLSRVKAILNFKSVTSEPLEKQPYDSSESDAHGDYKAYSFLKNFFFFVLILVSILIITLSFAIVFFEDANIKTNLKLMIETTEIFEVIYFAIVFLFLALAPFFVVKLKHKTNGNTTCFDRHNIWMLIDIIALCMANVFLFIRYAFRFYGFFMASSLNKIETIDRTINTLTLFASLLPIFQSLFQSVLLIVCTCQNRFKFKLDKKYVSVLILLNFALWVLDTFSVKRDFKYLSQTELVDGYIWKTMISIFIPLAIFYRFHSCIYLIKLNANLIKI
jgi:hypothetical protein